MSTPGGDAARNAWLLQQAENLRRDGHLPEATETVREALASNATLPQAWYMLGYLLRLQGEAEAALDAYAHALEHGVDHPEEVHLNRAVILSDLLLRTDDTRIELDAALAIAPDYLPALLNLGNLHEELGRRDEALEVYDRVLAIPAERIRSDAELVAEALARSVQLRPPVRSDDPAFARLDAAGNALPSRQASVRANLQFAAGKAYDRLGDHARAFDAFARANRQLMRSSPRYDRRATEQLIDDLIAAFREPARESTQIAADAPQPVFICGMFRSGSTLAEQILSTHPAVKAGGELEYLLREVSAGAYAPFPASVGSRRDDRDARVASGYLAMLRSMYPQANATTFVTDKRPDNFLLLGLIKRLFPRARIIHTRRDPMDVGLSIYMQHLNPQVAAYSTDLGDIAHYLSQHDRLMAHWQTLFGDDIHTFDYDAFVRDPQPQLEGLFGALGLETDTSQALTFHQQGNVVKTASYWQVRRPLYADASGRWRNYETQLEPLRAGLGAGGTPVRH